MLECARALILVKPTQHGLISLDFESTLIEIETWEYFLLQKSTQIDLKLWQDFQFWFGTLQEFFLIF